MLLSKSAVRRLAGLFVAWLVLTLWVEWHDAVTAVKSCRWPGGKGKHMALVADPQIVDDNTYPGRSRLLLWATRKVTDRYMAMNWRLVRRNLKPDVTFFLGDLFDGGREWEDQPWRQELERFQSVFPASRDKTHFQLPGNHDIGFGDTIVKKARDRFINEFGPSNTITPVGDNHLVVTLDTISLSNTVDADVRTEVENFITTFEPKKRIILLTHVPLNRPLGASCGPLRESDKPLPWQQGEQYMTQVGPELTNDILVNLRPVMVFSGDDHDACEYTHHYTLPSGGGRVAPEYVVKSFSMAMGIHRPGLELVTLSDTGESARICLLNDPYRPFMVLGLAAALSTAGLLVRIYLEWKRRLAKRNGVLPTYEEGDNAEAKALSQLKSQIPLWRPFVLDCSACLLGWFVGETVVTSLSYA